MSEKFLRMLESYLADEWSLEQFEREFYNASYSIESRYSGSVVSLAHNIEGILAESSSGHWSIAALRRSLEDVLLQYRPVQDLIHFGEGSDSSSNLGSMQFLFHEEAV
jgi:hypothetical protein